jgi:hypothetical protein
MAISAQKTTAQEQTMKAIINGKRYDTATATEVCRQRARLACSNTTAHPGHRGVLRRLDRGRLT